MIRKLLSLFLVAITPASFVAAQAESGAMLSPSGQSVIVNGNAMSRPSAIAAGDKIRVGANSAATLSISGSTAVFAANTDGALQSNGIGLDSGNVTVNTGNGLPVQAGPITATPSVASARYRVSRANCSIAVSAVQGDVRLSDGSTVREGQSANRAEPNCSATAGTPPAAAASAPGISNGTLIGIGAGAAAAAAAIALLTTGKPHVSPVQP